MARNPRTSSLIVGIVMSLLIWQSIAFLLHRPILPSPVEVLPYFFRLIPGELGLHLLASACRVIISVIVAVICAVPAGLVMGQFRSIDRLIYPLVAVFYPIPKIVFLPVIYVIMGITDLSKVFLIAMILFSQILVVVRDEAHGLSQELILSVKSLGAGRRALLRFVYLPASLPAVITALRVSVGTAIAVLFIAEQSLTTYGLGYYIVVETYQVLLYPQMYAGILAMGLMGLAFYLALESLEMRLNRNAFSANNNYAAS